jgi:D-sedoheptulose 7-phosphate isomerase
LYFTGFNLRKKLRPKLFIDCIFVLSVGGGDKEKGVSANLCHAIDYAKSVGAKVTGIVGRDGGYTARNSDICLVIPTVNPDTVTPHSESFQVVVWHLMVSHPDLKSNSTKW